MARAPGQAGSAPWLITAAILGLLVVAPVIALTVPASQGSRELWQHLIAYVLPDALADTFVLLGGVGVLSVVIGTGTAWLVTAYDFTGRRVLAWALLLPLAVPTYIIAYAYLDILHPVGPVQNAVRAVLGYDEPRDLRLPDIRSMAGCIVLLGFVLYPYVYLATRAMFLMQSANIIDAARTLGVSRRGVFFRVALPAARPAVVVGLTLALLEALNDIGASEFLGVRTMTVSIYSTWITRSDLPGAAQIALAMLAIVVAIAAIERRARQQRRYANDAQHARPLEPHRLSGWKNVVAVVAASVPVLIGFLCPVAYLIEASIARVRVAGLSPALAAETIGTVALSSIATALTIASGIAVAYAVRLGQGGVASVVARTASIGYAIPGTVLAIGLLPIVGGVEGIIDGLMTQVFGVSSGLLLLGSGAAIVYAYVARFLTIAAGALEAGLQRLPSSFDDAARTLGVTSTARLRLVHLPLLRPALGAAALLVFVDCMKELPATLLLRPLGFETLATHLYGEAVRGTYEDAAVAALLIVVAGLIPVRLLARLSESDATIVSR